MELLSWLHHNLTKQDSWHELPVVTCFYSASYPVLLLGSILEKIRATGATVHVIQDISDVGALTGQLGMSFLGMSYLYWLGNVSSLSREQLSRLITFAASYTGPHKLWFFIEADSPPKSFDSSQIVDCSLVITETSALELVTLLSVDGAACLTPNTRQFLTRLSSWRASLDPDTFLHLWSYSYLMGAGSQEFFNEWVPQMQSIQYSLFSLSGYLLSGNAREFFNLWAHISQDYGAPFWTAYWSEQLFRAYYYTLFMRENKVEMAKKIGNRLPFSFLQRDWKKAKLANLEAAHLQICCIDHAVKNGGSEKLPFDLLFFKLLQGS